MSAWILPFLEVTAVLLLVWCLIDAWRRGAGAVLELLAAAAFGLLVEQAAIWLGAASGRPDAYHYGRFAWMATAEVPFTVAAGWGAILYSGMKYSDRLGIPLWVRPFADALYALMLDLTMDVVAIHLGFWYWSVPAGEQWFGVPYSNFGGWLLIGLIGSTCLRLVRGLTARRQTGLPRWLSIGLPALSLAAAAAAGAWLTLMVAARLLDGTERDAWPVGLLAMLCAGLVVYGLHWRRTATPAQVSTARAGAGAPGPWPDPAVGLPVTWHATYLLAALITGAFAGRMALLFLTGLLATVGVVMIEALAPARPGR